MAANPCPRDTGRLRSFADQLLEGLLLHEEAIGIRQNNAAAMRAAIAATAGAEAQAGHALSARAKAYATLEAADDVGRAKLRDCKLRLAMKLGERWNAAWEATGFPDRSTAVPRTMDPRYVLLASLRQYFGRSPEHESAEMGATAAQCDAAWAVLHDARLAARLAETSVTAAIRARRAAFKTLRRRCRGLIVELWSLIPRDDPRWKSFGLKIPASRVKKDDVEENDGEQE